MLIALRLIRKNGTLLLAIESQTSLSKGSFEQASLALVALYNATDGDNWLTENGFHNTRYIWRS